MTQYILSCTTRHNRARIRYLYNKEEKTITGERKYTVKELINQFGFSASSMRAILKNVYGDDLSLDANILNGECGKDMEEALKREDETRQSRKIDRYTKYKKKEKGRKMSVTEAGTKTPSSANAKVSDRMHLIMRKGRSDINSQKTPSVRPNKAASSVKHTKQVPSSSQNQKQSAQQETTSTQPEAAPTATTISATISAFERLPQLKYLSDAFREEGFTEEEDLKKLFRAPESIQMMILVHIRETWDVRLKDWLLLKRQVEMME